ncbi:hypothetical protein ACN079_01375 [Pseudomonas sp. ABY48]|uniref:hypothetical protein n=1 Tax=Pseudomonas sp. ABY48 TaxID=3402865 RepID=UPI003B429DB5
MRNSLGRRIEKRESDVSKNGLVVRRREFIPLWEQGLPAMNDIAAQLLNRGATIAGKP